MGLETEKQECGGWPKKISIEKQECGDWLRKIADEAEISLSEIADGIGVKEEKVRKWASDERKMSRDEQREVTRFVARGVRYRGYQRMKSSEFSKLLRKLLFEFCDEITQEELAQKVGCSQKTISNCQNITIQSSLDVKTQYKILETFYGMCFAENHEVLEEHKDTFYKIGYAIDNLPLVYTVDELIELGVYEAGSIRDEDLDSFEVLVSIGRVEKSIKEKFAEFPCDLQDIILSHFSIFCFDYDHLDDEIAFITKIRRLSKECVNELIVQLKNSISYERYADASSLVFGEGDDFYINPWFDRITECRDMIKLLRENPNIIETSMKANKKHINRTERNKITFTKKFLTVIEEADQVLCGEYDRATIFREIDFKLTLSYIEWYIFMLVELSDMPFGDIMNLLNSISRRAKQ